MHGAAAQVPVNQPGLVLWLLVHYGVCAYVEMGVLLHERAFQCGLQHSPRRPLKVRPLLPGYEPLPLLPQLQDALGLIVRCHLLGAALAANLLAGLHPSDFIK